MTTRRRLMTSIITVMLLAIVGTANAQNDAIFFHAGFDGGVQGMLGEESLDPTVTQGLRFATSDNSRALKVEAGKSIGYDLGDTFPNKAGALEIRFRPDFPQTADSPERDGTTERTRNELPGLRVVEELFGRRPVYYTTEFNKAPQSIFASCQAGLPTIGYLTVPTRGHGAVWYCNSFVPSCESARERDGSGTFLQHLS